MDTSDFINRSNAEYIERLYQQYQTDPRSLDLNWQAFFAGLELAGGGRLKPGVLTGTAAAAAGGEAGCDTLGVEIADLVHSYRELGHFIANLDPLGHNRTTHPLLEMSEFGLKMEDMGRTCGNGGVLGTTDGTVRDLLTKLRATYCSTLGVQYMDISDKAQREWLQQRMEPALNHPPVSADQAKEILYQLVAAQGFEEFCQKRFQGTKRFSLEGGESLIPRSTTWWKRARTSAWMRSSWAWPIAAGSTSSPTSWPSRTRTSSPSSTRTTSPTR